MIEVDIAELLKKLNELQTTYSSLETNQLNLFSSLTTICTTDWKDANSIAMEKDVYTDKLEAENFKNNVWSKISIVEYIYNQYCDLAKKIKCNISGKSTILNLLDNCIDIMSDINDEFDEIDTTFYYPELYTIKEKKRICANRKKDLVSIKDDFETLYYKIEEIESNVADKIASLEDFKVEAFKYTSGNNDVISGAYLEKGLFEQDKGKIVFYAKEENDDCFKLYKSMNDFSSCYKSTNVVKFTQTLNNFKSSYTSLYDKRKAYISALEEIPPLYGVMIAKVKEEFGGDV